jgi:hypothetical protein
MLGKVKFSKIAVVIFLTVLIWVWTDLALDETYPVSGATIVLTDSSPQLWISFDGERSISIDSVLLRGPASKITNVRRKIEDRSLSLNFPLDAEQEGIVDTNELDVQGFLQKSVQLRDSGLMVESCEPAKLSISVVELGEKPLAVECYDESGTLLTVEIEQPTVNVLVPDDWPQSDKARVVLTRDEIERAKEAPVKKKAHIVLADGQRRASSTTVEIKIPPEEERLQKHRVSATIGICLSENLLGRFDVDLLNRNDVMDLIAIRATTQAKAAYEGQEKPLTTLYIFDRDEEKGQEEQRRPVVYNFPEDHVRQNNIILDQTAVEARFKLIPLPSAENP